MHLIKIQLKALEKKAIAGGVSILKGITVNGFNKENNGIVKSVITDQGIIECDQVVIGAGPWVRDFWNMLGLPKK
jgi:glycine/D-amino acid oxidase-like deaminating enzyme